MSQPEADIIEDVKTEESQQEEKKMIKKGISWTLDSDLSNDGLSSNERLVKIMARNNSNLLGKWQDATILRAGKIEIARTVLKEFHECGATHRQKPDDMVKGITTLFKRYHTFKEKLAELGKTAATEYDQNGNLQFISSASSVKDLVAKQCPFYLELTKAYDVLYKFRPELNEENNNTELVEEVNNDTQLQNTQEISSSDDEQDTVEYINQFTNREGSAKRNHCKTCDSKWNKEKQRLKRLKTEAKIKRFEAMTRRYEFETQERVLALHARYNEPRFIGSDESKAADLIFKNTFPSLFSHNKDYNNYSHHHSESEIDELDE